MYQSFHNSLGERGRRKKGGDTLPDPPDYKRWDFRIPPFYAIHHPYTKWMLNMIRSNAIHRLATMIKERPQLFRQYFQLSDSPEILTHDNKDHTTMFHERCILYLTPLCLAVYLKRDKVVDLLMKSGLNNPYQSCFATEVFMNRPPDILEICAACVALKREFFQALPLLCQSSLEYSQPSGDQLTLKIDEPISLRYVTCDSKRYFRYHDLLNYGTELLLRNPNYPLNRLVESLALDCAEFYDASKMSEDVKGEKVSLFRRLTRFAYYDDVQCRVSLQLISCFETLLRNQCVPWKARPSGKTCAEDPDFILKHLQTRTPLILDQDACLLLLSGLYHRLRMKCRGVSRLNHLGHVVHRLLTRMQWLPVFQSITLEDLQLISGNINECIPLTKQTLLLLQQHVNAITEMEKTREFVLYDDMRIRRERSRSYRTTCAHNTIPHPILVGSSRTRLSSSVNHNERAMPYVQQITRPRRPAETGWSRKSPQVYTYRHGLPSSRRRRCDSDPSQVSMDVRGGFESSANMQQVREGWGDLELDRNTKDDIDEDVTSVTEWKELEPLNVAEERQIRQGTPLSHFSQAVPVVQDMQSNTFVTPTRRSTQWTPVSGVCRSRSTDSVWRAEQSPGLPGNQHRSPIRTPVHRSDIEAYESRVLGAMCDDYECTSDTHGDFLIPDDNYHIVGKTTAWQQQRAWR